MRALVAALLLFAAGPAPARGEAPSWAVDKANSRVGFIARQMAVPVPGHFPRFDAEIRFDPRELAQSKAVIDIDVASVETPNRDIETEIKRESWFHVASFPTARFETISLIRRGGARYDAIGRLTLRGVTREVVLAATIRVADDPARPDRLRAEAVGEVTVSRTAFGIGQGQWRDTAVVADEVVIRIDIVAFRPKPPE